LLTIHQHQETQEAKTQAAAEAETRAASLGAERHSSEAAEPTASGTSTNPPTRSPAKHAPPTTADKGKAREVDPQPADPIDMNEMDEDNATAGSAQSVRDAALCRLLCLLTGSEVQALPRRGPGLRAP
jgi:hypothetical protein